MAYDVFISLDKEVVTKLPFLEEGFQYLHVDSSGKVYRGILYEMNQENYDKATLRLQGKAEGEIVTGDKVFVMSGCSIPQFKIKEYLKSKGAVLVSDITIATKFIGNKDIWEDTVSGGQRSSALLTEMQYSRIMNEKNNEDLLKSNYEELLETPSSSSVDLTDSRYSKVLIATGMTIFQSIDIIMRIGSYRQYFITPLGAMILYQSILRSVPIISDGFIFEKLEKTIEFDQDVYNSVKDMLASKDPDNHRVGADILANCEIEKSLFWIWKLARDHSHRVSTFSQFKNIRLFIDKSRWNYLTGLDAEQFIEYMKEKGLLTIEYFNELIEPASDNYMGVVRSEVFDMVLVPSAKYKEFNVSKHVFPFSKVTYGDSTEVLNEYDGNL